MPRIPRIRGRVVPMLIVGEIVGSEAVTAVKENMAIYSDGRENSLPGGEVLPANCAKIRRSKYWEDCQWRAGSTKQTAHLRPWIQSPWSLPSLEIYAICHLSVTVMITTPSAISSNNDAHGETAWFLCMMPSTPYMSVILRPLSLSRSRFHLQSDNQLCFVS